MSIGPPSHCQKAYGKRRMKMIAIFTKPVFSPEQNAQMGVLFHDDRHQARKVPPFRQAFVGKSGLVTGMSGHTWHLRPALLDQVKFCRANRAANSASRRRQAGQSSSTPETAALSRRGRPHRHERPVKADRRCAAVGLSPHAGGRYSPGFHGPSQEAEIARR